MLVLRNSTNLFDNSHYTPDIGDSIINRIFDYQIGKVPDDFGVLLTTDNLEEHIDNIKQKRQKWLKNNPEEVNLVRKIFTQTQNVN